MTNSFGEDMSQIEQPGLCERYISSAWSELATVAWYEYLAKGKGLLYLDFKSMGVIRLDEVIVDVVYIPESEIIGHSIEVGITPSLCANLMHAVFIYDPEREVVTVSKMPDGSMLDYYVEKEPTPPEAFLKRAEVSTEYEARAEVIN